MIWKTLIAVAILALVAGTGLWIAHGCEILTKDRIAVVTESVDPLFGTKESKTTWVETFKFGLLPDDDTVMAAPRSLAFVAGASCTVLIVSIVMQRRGRRKRA